MEELIKLETAQKAKNKGLTGIKWNSGKSYMSNGDIFKHEIVEISDPKKYTHYPFAITQSVLAKWLRENHNIDVFLDSVGGRSGYYYVLQYVDSGNQIKTGDTYHIFEEAYEKGLFEALNLLEDVN
jgi:hypothetical protein